MPEIQFDQSQQWLMQGVLALITLGIALELHWRDFLLLTKQPHAIATGLLAQFVLLPAATWLLITLLDIHPGFGLGMMLAACCPGGGLSNFFTAWGRGNIALSVALTATASFLAAVVMPLNFAFWAGLQPSLQAQLRAFDIDIWAFAQNLSLVLLLPLLLGMFVRSEQPRWAERLRVPLRGFSFVMLAVFIGIGLWQNLQFLPDWLAPVFGLVLLHNTVAMGVGWGAARLSRLKIPERRAVTLEVGIQNAAIGLAVVYTFFDGNGFMMMIIGWWGIWHMVAGSVVAGAFRFADRTSRQVS